MAIANAPKRWLTRGVLGIGLTSLFSDWSHEAATAILPAFLASLGAPAAALGIIEGVSDGLSSFAKLGGGFVADHPALRKPAGIMGYLTTALTTFGYAFAQSWPVVLCCARSDGWGGEAEDRRGIRCWPPRLRQDRKGAPSVSSAQWIRSARC